MSLVATILGCGSSAGVPRVGQGWGACDPDNPRNRRRRCSLLVERAAADGAKTIVVVDTCPDLRQQFLDAGVERLDAILMTHAHADHTHGIDDVRPLVQSMGRRIDIYMDEPTARIVRPSFAYIFETPPDSLYEPLLNEKRVVPGEKASLNGPGGAIDFVAFRLNHGEIDALGYRIGDMAYTPDLNGVPDESAGWLAGLDLWIVDALRQRRHSSHFCLKETLAAIARFAPRRAILTDLSSELDYDSLRRLTPPGVEIAHDGMQIVLGG